MLSLESIPVHPECSRRYLLTTPQQKIVEVWALPFSLAATKGMVLREAQNFVSFPPLTEMFHFSGFAPGHSTGRQGSFPDGFPHSEIPGSKVAKHLPEAYRSHATSFIAAVSRGIHHLPINRFSWLVINNHLAFSLLSCKGLSVCLL